MLSFTVCLSSFATAAPPFLYSKIKSQVSCLSACKYSKCVGIVKQYICPRESDLHSVICHIAFLNALRRKPLDSQQNHLGETQGKLLIPVIPARFWRESSVVGFVMVLVMPLVMPLVMLFVMVLVMLLVMVFVMPLWSPLALRRSGVKKSRGIFPPIFVLLLPSP